MTASPPSPGGGWRGGGRNQLQFGAECLLNLSTEKQLCSLSSSIVPCSCCSSCLDTSCSSRGDGWRCVAAGLVESLPAGEKPKCTGVGQDCNSWSLQGDTLVKEPCQCCHMDVGQNCRTTDRCQAGFPESGLRGFCGDQSLLGGDCYSRDNATNQVCGTAECTCCKECLDKDCSAKGDGWDCYGKEEALAMPEDWCLFDGSCPQSPGSPTPPPAPAAGGRMILQSNLQLNVTQQAPAKVCS